MIRAALLLALALLAAPAAAESVTVLRVIDGDTIVTAEHGTVRLRGIDAPESCQAWGPQATRALRAKLAGADASLHTIGRDRYGRTLAWVRADGRDVQALMVARGHAWAMRSVTLARTEQHAQSRRLGLHADPNAMRPGEFRKHHRCPR